MGFYSRKWFDATSFPEILRNEVRTDQFGSSSFLGTFEVTKERSVDPSSPHQGGE